MLTYYVLPVADLGGGKGAVPPKTPDALPWGIIVLQLHVMQAYIPCLFNMQLIASSVQSNQSIPSAANC